jgi:hypothetical protein
MGIDQTVYVRLRCLFNRKNVSMIVECCKQFVDEYQLFLLFDCENKCKNMDIVSHIIATEDDPDNHDTSSLDIKIDNLWFSLLFVKNEYNKITLILTPSAGNPKFDYPDRQYGFPLDKYIKEIILPLIDPFCIENIQITQCGEPLELTDSIKVPYIVGYASMGHHNFTHEHVKMLVGNLSKSGIKIIRDNQALKLEEIENTIWQAIEKNEVEYLDAIYDQIPFKVGIGEDEEGNIKIIPQRQLKMKKTEDGECIDMGFYVQRLLDIVEGFYLFGLNTSGF